MKSNHPASLPCVLLRMDDLVYYLCSTYALEKPLHCFTADIADAYIFPSITQARKFAFWQLGLKHGQYRIVPLAKAARRWYT